MKWFENRRCLCVFVTVCDNPSKCVLKKMLFAHVETGQTPEGRVAVIKVTTHQGIGFQDTSLVCQILSSRPGIMHLREACLTRFAEMISERKLASNKTLKFFTTTVWMHQITKYPDREEGI